MVTCTRFESVLLVYRLEAVAHRYVSKGNMATDHIYRVFRRMKDGLPVAMKPVGLVLNERPEPNLLPVRILNPGRENAAAALI